MAFRDVKLEGSEKVNDVEDDETENFVGATLSLTHENNTSSPLLSGTATNEALSAGSGLATDDTFNANLEGLPPSVRTSHRPSTARGLSGGNIREFFAVRNGALENAAEQCRPVILENLDGELRGVWLLTEIDHWDAEKERILFLTDYSLISLKYDFITLKLLDYKRLHLKEFDSIIIGELKYPDSSLMPKITGAVDFIKGRVMPRIRQGTSQATPEPSPEVHAPPPPETMSVPIGEEDAKRPRNQIGVRCKWNQGQPLPFLKNWNPWSREIPWVTYTSHPLIKQEGLQKSSYDIEDFAHNMAQTLEHLDLTKAPPHDMLTPLKTCDIEYQPILIENYAGVVSAFHNANDFGFFKARGKVSF